MKKCSRIMGLLATCAGILGGCASEFEDQSVAELASDEDVGVQGLPFGENSCPGAAPNVTMSGGTDVNVPAGYDHPWCDRAYIAQVNNYSLSGTYNWFKLIYTGPPPANETICENMQVRMDVYKLVNGVFTHQGRLTNDGVWETFFNRCGISPLYWRITSGGTYKIAMQVTRNLTETQKINFSIFSH